jgi:DNA-binding ferritin-like protein
MLKNLMEGHVTIQNQLKEIVMHGDSFAKDRGSEDLLVGLLRKHETMGWMLRSHIV